MFAKANKKYMKDYDKNKESSYIQYWDINNLYERQMLQKLLLNNFERIKDTSQFNKVFIKNYDEKAMKDIFSKLVFNILKNYMTFTMICLFYMKE